MEELVVTASSSVGTVNVWKTAGTTHMHQSGPNASLPRGVAVLRAHIGYVPQWVVAAQENKPAIHVWRWGKEGIVFKCATPERMGPVAATPDGAFLFAGGKSGTIYAWEVCSGELVAAVDAHFKAVTSLAVSDDGSLVASGGDDATVHLWALPTLVDGGIAEASARRPLRSWAECSLPITDVAFAAGAWRGSVLATSADRTLHVYDAHADKPTATTVLPEAPLCVRVHPSQGVAFVGGSEGSVFEVGLHGAAAGGADGSDLPAHVRRWSRHEDGVACIAVSADGTALVCGSLDGTASVLDAASGQTVATYRGHAGPVTFASFELCPVGLARRGGAAEAGVRGDGVGWAGAVPLAPLKKLPGTRAGVPLTAVLAGTRDPATGLSAADELQDDADFLAAAASAASAARERGSAQGDSAQLRERIAALEAETRRLEGELTEARRSRQEEEGARRAAAAEASLRQTGEPVPKRRRRKQQRK